jgi:hypothetical protein
MISLAITRAQRKQMEDLIYKVFDDLDKTQVNSKKYRAMFGSMSDPQFDSFFSDFFKDDNQYLVLDVVDYERTLSIEDVEKAAHTLGVPLFERVAMPHIDRNDESSVLSQYEVPVGYVHLKRAQQMVAKKNTTSTEISSRSALTGQVVGRDKNARDSDSENFGLVTLNATNTLRELMGPRADDMVMKGEMYSSIAQKEFVSLDSLTNNVENKTTLNALDVYLMGMGLKSDLVTQGLLIKKTLNT